MNPRRVVITGIGAITPVGKNAPETWKNILNGKSGVSQTTLFDTTDCPVKISAEVKNFDLAQLLSSLPANRVQEIKHMARFTHLAITAGLEAYEDSGLAHSRHQIAPERIGVYMGVGIGGFPEIENQSTHLALRLQRRMNPFFIPQIIANMASGQLSILFNFKGPNLCYTTACASSTHSIGEAFQKIRNSEVEVIMTGGAEAVICQLGIKGFVAMRALSIRNDAPEKASRPFDSDRDGFVMGEGAAILILEEMEFALKRGAKIYAEIVGYGLSGDAHHMTDPAPKGEGGYRAMKEALEGAQIQPEQIGYINAHATSTLKGDMEEIQAIARLFPHASQHLHVSSTKSMTAHLLGAAGAVEAIFSTLAVKEGKIPPTINLDHVDPTCAHFNIPLTPHHSIEKKLEYSLSNSFGFGGFNASLIFRKVSDESLDRF